MRGKPDRQRSRVYEWENRVVAPQDPTFVPLPAAQGMVNAIWRDMGLSYPPAVEALPQQATQTIACANRLTIYLRAQVPSWCLLHELAHAMTTTVEGCSDGHGEIFMGVYLQLITRYLRLDPDELVRTAREAGLRVDVAARPVFLDPAM